MVSNSSSVPRRMLRKSGMSPMPSGNSRQTSSVTPGRMVGLIMPTTPRQLENAMAPLESLLFIVALRCFRRHIALGQILGKRGGVAAARIAVAAAARALQEEALA